MEIMNKKIQIGDPLEKAFDRTIEYCFQPFKFTKWLTMGFIAWVITLGENGFNFRLNFPTGNWGGAPSKIFMGQTKSISSDISNFINNTLTTEIIVYGIIIATIIILVFLAIWVVMMWLKARFEFMFLDNIIFDRYNIKQPWRDFNREGTSLFKWKILLGVISTLIVTSLMLLGLGIAIKMCWSSLEAEQLLQEGKTGLIIGGLLVFVSIIAGITLSVISFIVNKLLVPIMYKEKVTLKQAWRKFRPAFRENKWNISLFVIVYWIVVIAVGSVALIVLFIVMILTCFFFCLGFIPFVSGFIIATLMLPVTIFFGMFSYEYAMQFPLSNLIDEVEVVDLDSAEERFDGDNSFDPKTL